MKIFVTGATGFIGLHLLRHLLRTTASNDTIYCLVRDPKKMDPFLRTKVTICKGDHLSLIHYTKELLSCEYVYHIAAKADLGDGPEYVTHNIQFTRDLVSILQLSKTLRRFVFTSSIAAVDRCPSDTCTKFLNEQSLPNPLTDYGKSKLECEQILRSSSLSYTIIRPTWVYGPGMRKNSHIRVFINGIRKNSLFTKFDFPGKVSVIYIEDLVNAITLAAFSAKANRQTYFVSDGVPVSLGSLLSLIGRYYGRSAGYIRFPQVFPFVVSKIRRHLPLTVQNIFMNVLCATPKKLFSLGFKPQYSLEKGIIATMHWNALQYKDKNMLHALVTGGANGIGKELSIQLYGEGYTISILDKDKENLKTIQQLIDCTAYKIDLSKITGIHKAGKIIYDQANSISLLVNNAGIGSRGEFWNTPIEKSENILMVNTMAPMYLSQIALSQWQDDTQHHELVNIVSSAAFQPLPYMSTYSSTKAMVLRFTEGLIGELYTYKNQLVKIFAISPSGTNTSFQKVSGVKNAGDNLLSPNYVASSIRKLMRKSSGSYIIGYSGRLMSFASRILPTHIVVRLWSNLMRTYR